jgi:HlyD family secretion protein
MAIRVRLSAEEGIEGRVASASPAADPRTGLYQVKLRLANPSRAIKPGMLARVSFPLETRNNVLVVPNQAIFIESGIEFVFVASSGVVHKRQVSIGAANETITEVTAGLVEGEEVVLDGQSFLNEGDAVSVVQ